jgi:hypothetical protein
MTCQRLCVCGFQHEPKGVLRRQRWQVQLPEQRAVRHAGRVRVLQPVVVPELGRHPPDGGGVQEDLRWLAQRGLLPPGHLVVASYIELQGLVELLCIAPEVEGADRLVIVLSGKKKTP